MILSGDHIYKMDYEVMLDFHKENNADVTIAAMPVPLEEASRFGIVITDDEGKIEDFERKNRHSLEVISLLWVFIFSGGLLKRSVTGVVKPAEL